MNSSFLFFLIYCLFLIWRKKTKLRKCVAVAKDVFFLFSPLCSYCLFLNMLMMMNIYYFYLSFYPLLIVLVSFFSIYIYHLYCLFVSRLLFLVAGNKKTKQKVYSLNISHSRRFYPFHSQCLFEKFPMIIELTLAGDKLVMVRNINYHHSHFHSINHLTFRCGLYKTIPPHIDHLSSQYPNAVFLKADVEICTVSFQSYLSNT